MPELPEVEGARRLSERNCLGKTIVAAVVADDEKVINDVTPKQLEQALLGRTLVAAKRRGKQMWWDFDSGPSLLLHLGMTGGVVVKGVGAAHYKNFVIDDAAWPPRFCKLELRFGDGTQLAFCDSRRFAKVRFLEEPETKPPISLLGWDPVLDMPALEAFAASLAAQRRVIKGLLLDQSFSAGVGNWVADEVLYQARIHPEQPSNTIPAEQVAALHAAIKHVCEFACCVEADSHQFPDDWLFHYRWGKGSGTPSKVGGRTIDHITVGGRTSAYVPALQKLDRKAVAAAAAAKPAAKKAGGGRGKKAAAAEAAADDTALAEAAAEAAVAVAQGGPKPRGGRGRAAAARAAAAVAAEVVEAAAELTEAVEDAEPEPALRQPGKGRRGKKAAAPGPAPANDADQEGVDGGQAAAASGRGTKSFRGGRRAAAAAASSGPADGDGSKATGSASGKNKAAVDKAGASAAGRRKRKTATGTEPAGPGAADEVKHRPSRARKG